MAYERIEHAGGAIATTLASGITSGDTNLTLDAATGWPTGGTGKFYIVIDPDLANEEKILCTARSSTSLTGLTRGVDGTSASAHNAGATVVHIFSATEADEANVAVTKTVGQVTTKGDLLAATGSQSLGRLAAGTNGLPLVAKSSETAGLAYEALAAGGLASNAVTTAKILDGNVTRAKLEADAVDGTKLADDAVDSEHIADGAIDAAHLASNAVETAKIKDGNVTAAKIADEAWSSYTPTWTATSSNPTIGNGTLTGAYLQLGSIVFFRIRVEIGSSTNLGSGLYSFALPVAPKSGARQNIPGHVFVGTTVGHAVSGLTANDGSPIIDRVRFDGSALGHNNPSGMGGGSVITFTGMYEAD